MAHESTRAVVTAIVANAILTVLKFGTALVTHSASMMNEAAHSLMDTLNQMLLYFGLVAAQKPADIQYAFGHGQKKYLWNLWGAIGLFSIGAGLGLAHAWHSYHLLGTRDIPLTLTLFGHELKVIWVSFGVLAIALVLEGYSFVVAIKEFFKRMRADGQSNAFLYIAQSDDPTLVAVVLEDSVAVLGLLLAALGIGLAYWFGNPIWDIAFSVLIAVMLGVIAFFLGRVNMRYLTDVRDHDAEKVFSQIAREHREVERYHDLRSIILDEKHTVLVAEVELREEAMVPRLHRQINEYERKYVEMLPSHRRTEQRLLDYCKARAAAQATLERTEAVIEELAAELKARAPQVSHVTIEVEGIATTPSPEFPETAYA
ncbi:MAG: cation diffusion facilitator family transporter [Acidiferrobacterales bacterium]